MFFTLLVQRTCLVVQRCQVRLVYQAASLFSALRCKGVGYCSVHAIINKFAALPGLQSWSEWDFSVVLHWSTLVKKQYLPIDNIITANAVIDQLSKSWSMGPITLFLQGKDFYRVRGFILLSELDRMWTVMWIFCRLGQTLCYSVIGNTMPRYAQEDLFDSQSIQKAITFLGGGGDLFKNVDILPCCIKTSSRERQSPRCAQ